ncbi:RNA-directed DNA polymerase, eukaryota [Tanacetum coccineum]
MTWYFTQIRPITKSFTIDEKLVWLEITGLPLHAWTTNAFKKIATVWGEPMFVDEDPNENMATGITHKVHVKEFAGWSPDIDVAAVVSDEVNELESTDNESYDNHNKDVQEEEEGELKDNVPNDGPALQSDQHHADPNPPTNAKPQSWADEVVMEGHLDDQVANNENLQTEALQHEEETKQSQTKTPSHPPSFEGFKVHSCRNSINKGNKRSKGHSSAFSFIDKKVTNEGKSKSSSKLRSNGSLIEAFISHIEMGNVLGYDMEDSKADLKKFIDGIDANDIH